MMGHPSREGVLYVVSTPIGNLEDITLRALKILGEVDFIVAEDTRTTRKLLSHYDIHTRLTSFFEGNIKRKVPFLIRRIKEGKSIALVSEAGTPGISDPGYTLIREAVKEDIEIHPLPGPTALIAALSISGFPSDRFVFEGMLPRKKSNRKKRLEKFRGEERTIVFYESPHRLMDTLMDIRDILGDRNIVVAREMTKKFEEVVRGKASELLEHFLRNKPRGEFVLVVEGKRGE